MKAFTIQAGDAGKRLDRWLAKQLPALPAPLAQKYMRLKRIKLNGRGTRHDARLNAGDLIQLYIGDEFFEQPKQIDSLLSSFRPHLNILYEDARLLLIDKQPGLLVHPDEKEKLNTLVTHVRAYLYQKGEYDSKDPAQFAPVPCNRIDRFTGGIVLVAKTAEAMRVLNQKIRDHEIEKSYLCIVRGRMKRACGLLDNYILKPEGQRRVRVLHHPEPGAQHAQTRYSILAQEGALSLVECTLLTGRTHQIRAQFADAGCPLLGDTQYGSAQANQRFDREFQALYAYKLTFAFESDAGVLNGLAGQSFEVPNVPFVKTYFPNYQG